MTKTSTRTRTRRLLPAALAVAGLVVVSGTSGAVAGAMITGADIKDGTVTGKDIKDGSLGYQDTSRALDREHRKVGGYKLIRKTQVVAQGDGINGLTASCPTGRQILGMTAYWVAAADVPQLVPQGDRTRTVRAYGRSTSGGQTDTATIVLYCGRTTPN
jgi:hypothetical protein